MSAGWRGLRVSWHGNGRVGNCNSPRRTRTLLRRDRLGKAISSRFAVVVREDVLKVMRMRDPDPPELFKAEQVVVIGDDEAGLSCDRALKDLVVVLVDQHAPDALSRCYLSGDLRQSHQEGRCFRHWEAELTRECLQYLSPDG